MSSISNQRKPTLGLVCVGAMVAIEELASYFLLISFFIRGAGCDCSLFMGTIRIKSLCRSLYCVSERLMLSLVLLKGSTMP